MKRRDFIIKSSLAGMALVALPKIYSQDSKITKLQVGNPLRFPPELQEGESLKFNSANVEVWPGTTTQVLALNNSYPGPTIRVQKGDDFSVLFENQFTEEATIHWHGLLVPELMDGQPKDAVQAGSNYTYSFPIIQRAGTYFYHSHAHHLTAKHVYKGYAGFFIIEDDDELQYGLPTGAYDIPLLIQDRHSVYQPQFNYAPNMMDRMLGYLGDIPLVNGTPDAFFDVQKTLYRFRIVNGSNARVYNFGFSDNSQFWIIGTDGGLKDEAVPVSNVFLSPGERIEILYDFSPIDIGNSVSLQSQAFSGIGNQGTLMDILRFDIAGDSSSGGVVPQNLLPIDYYDINDKTGTRTFTLSQAMMGTGMHRINGLTYDMNRIDEVIPFNELEEWKFINSTNNYHPMHVHGVLFQIYSRNGNTTLASNDKGWKDTVLVKPNETVQALVKFIDYSGTYLLHCHNLEHEDDGMMLNIKIDTPTNIEDENTSPNNFELYQNYPNPFNPSTTIKFKLTNAGFATLTIFSLLGTKIETIFAGNKSSGSHSITYTNKSLASGTYIYELKVNGYALRKKMILLK
ncbi:MAG: multicopper oxidase domain-containing protein [Ignavibacteriae bacterium]|nr:T9SS C-terminal target domain-containing protein [Ignavibacteriota bacterium]NOG99769.1 multicopper oxidase domain-containing protein [Ignavibacteriota bacterium]